MCAENEVGAEFKVLVAKALWWRSCLDHLGLFLYPR